MNKAPCYAGPKFPGCMAPLTHVRPLPEQLESGNDSESHVARSGSCVEGKAAVCQAVLRAGNSVGS